MGTQSHGPHVPAPQPAIAMVARLPKESTHAPVSGIGRGACAPQPAGVRSLATAHPLRPSRLETSKTDSFRPPRSTSATMPGAARRFRIDDAVVDSAPTAARRRPSTARAAERQLRLA